MRSPRIAPMGTPGERAVGLFILGFVLFTPPFLSIFSQEIFLFGIPLLFLYIFAAWGTVVFLIARNAFVKGPRTFKAGEQKAFTRDDQGGA